MFLTFHGAPPPVREVTWRTRSQHSPAIICIHELTGCDDMAGSATEGPAGGMQWSIFLQGSKLAVGSHPGWTWVAVLRWRGWGRHRGAGRPAPPSLSASRHPCCPPHTPPSTHGGAGLDAITEDRWMNVDGVVTHWGPYSLWSLGWCRRCSRPQSGWGSCCPWSPHSPLQTCLCEGGGNHRQKITDHIRKTTLRLGLGTDAWCHWRLLLCYHSTWQSLDWWQAWAM